MLIKRVSHIETEDPPAPINSLTVSLNFTGKSNLDNCQLEQRLQVEEDS